MILVLLTGNLLRHIASKVGISQEGVYSILTEDLAMRNPLQDDCKTRMDTK